ncbi:MAG: GerMN domain-containing protein [Clostridium sp.]|uniref:GerMN domain-containing protein n=1 Tax=Clostridium sp. TaxID=1506 RepID=UPI002FCC4353
MRRKIFTTILTLLALAFIFTSCSKSNAKPEDTDSNKPQVQVNFKELFPYTKDAKLEYFNTTTKKSTEVKVKSNENNTIVLSSLKETNIKFSNDGILINNEYILKLPLENNSSWDITGGKVTLKNNSAPISTGLGDFYGYEIEIKKDPITYTLYFVKNLGIVKIVELSNNTSAEYILSSIEASLEDGDNEPGDNNLSAEVDNIYYYDVEKDAVIEKPIDKDTSSKDAKKFFENLFKSPPSGIKPLMPASTKINNIKVDNAASLITLDVSESFTETMNLGTSGEEGILQSIANTLGKSYKCKNVVITVNSKPYATGHLLIDKDNPLTVE